MDHQTLLERVETAWAEFQASYAGLSDEQMTQPGVVGEWSLKDILAHVTTWEQEALKALPVILRGERLPRYKDLYGGINAFNAQMAEKKRDLSLAEIRRQMEETHRQVIETIQNAPEEQIRRETPFRRRVKLDTYSHYPEHTKAIREWRERLSSPADSG